MPPATRTSYRALLASVVALYREEPVLRRRGLYGALGFAGFSTLWTSVAFLLDDEYGYGEAMVGLFGLLGVAGALAAQFAGRLADRGWARVSTLGFFALVAVSWIVLAAGERSLAAVVVGIVLLDLARQGRAHLQPERGLPAAPRGPQPDDHRLHVRELHRGRGRLGLVGRVLRPGRLDRGVRRRASASRCWRWSPG